VVAVASPSRSSSPLPKMSDWAQYHRDAGRAGVGPATPAIHNPSRAWTSGVDGSVYASPLIVDNHVIVATENNTVYSLDLVSGSQIWKKHLGSPVIARTLPCGNIQPVTGITGTPAADASTGKLYVVAFLAGYHHVLFTLSLADGAVLAQTGVDPAGSNPVVEQERGALALSSAGYVYVPFGGLLGDCGDYHGYVVGVPLAGGPSATYRTPSARESGIWTSMGPTISPSGSVYVSTGNGSFSGVFDYSNSVLELSPSLRVQSFFAPANWPELDAGDVDLGSVGVAVLPSLGVAVSIGKGGVAYVLNLARLGGVGGQVASLRVCSAAWGGSAWTGTTVFLPCADGLVAAKVGARSLSVLWKAAQVRIASPIVAAGAVWAIDVDTATLFALDPERGSVLYRLGLGAAEHFSTGAATEGYVVVPAGSKVVAVATAP
jgi:outer membrane protein assembly factor BamB